MASAGDIENDTFEPRFYRDVYANAIKRLWII